MGYNSSSWLFYIYVFNGNVIVIYLYGNIYKHLEVKYNYSINKNGAMYG